MPETEALEELKSLDDVCENLGWVHFRERRYHLFEYSGIRKEGDTALFTVPSGKWGPMKVGFETNWQDFANLMSRFKEYVETAKPYAEMRKNEKEEYQDKFSDFAEKLRVYAIFAPKDFEMDFDGFCYLCGHEREVTVKNRSVYYSCGPCAEMTDTFD